ARRAEPVAASRRHEAPRPSPALARSPPREHNIGGSIPPRSQHNEADRPEGRSAGGVVLKEKELRIALVCFGGVSLAVYMHGITKEILKLARASAALHAIRDRTLRARAEFPAAHAASNGGDALEYDTEPFYFELLR